MKELILGDRAPAWHLTDAAGTTISSTHFIGKKNLVLVFYPGDMTPGCTLQLCALRDDWPKFQKKHIAVFGINHADAESHATFSRKYHLPFPLLTDTKKKVSTAYNAIRKIGKLVLIKRRVIGIDMEGRIQYLKNGMPKTSDILKVFSSH
jgi:thioredoxin-dependent peroxiredoxin